MKHPFYRAGADDADASIELPEIDGRPRSLGVRISREKISPSKVSYEMHLDYEIDGNLFPIGSLPIDAGLFYSLFPPK